MLHFYLVLFFEFYLFSSTYVGTRDPCHLLCGWVVGGGGAYLADGVFYATGRIYAFWCILCRKSVKTRACTYISHIDREVCDESSFGDLAICVLYSTQLEQALL